VGVGGDEAGVGVGGDVGSDVGSGVDSASGSLSSLLSEDSVESVVSFETTEVFKAL